MKRALFLILLLAAPALAETNKAVRPATKADLIGTWDLVDVRPVKDPKDPAFFPYQRFNFRPDSSMKFMASPAPFDPASEAKFRNEPAVIDYTVDEKGILTLSWKNGFTQRMVTGYFDRDFPAEMAAKLAPDQRHKMPKKSDLTLNYLSGDKLAYQKVLRKRD